MEYDTDFKSLIPPISKEEHRLLTGNIRKDGCRDPIVIWTETLSNGETGRTMILDGHNRYQICKQYKIEFMVTELKLKDMKEARIWVIQNQLGRRNLTSYQKGKLTLELKTMIQERAKEQQGTRTDISQKSVESPIDTQKELAKIAGISHDTIHKIEVIEKEAPPEIKEAASSGEISINKAYMATKKSTDIEPKEISLRKDSKNLSQLKFYWGEASTGDRKKFRRWLHTQKD